MKKYRAEVLVSIFLCLAMLAGCSSAGSEAQKAPENGSETAASRTETETSSEEEIEEAEEDLAEEKEEALEAGPASVVFTVFSADDSRAFEGKEMTADPVYLETALSSEVYSCSEPLERIEVHPIVEWAEDFSSFTLSEEILGEAGPAEAGEPFRIFDLYPEGIPVNCLVFYLEDGRSGTFALGYNGSGEEQSWECPVYENYESMVRSREEEIKEGRGEG